MPERIQIVDENDQPITRQEAWANAASGHVDEGETYETSAPRELAEEIGVTTPLTFVGKFPCPKAGGGQDHKPVQRRF